MEYYIRGPLVQRACEIQNELEKGENKPFNEVIKMNIGDAQAMGQTPITFMRQMYALVTYPRLLNSSDFPDDVKMRAKEILNACSAKTIGSYSDTLGIEIVRKSAAKYIEQRDGFPSSWKNIYLTAGASQGIKAILQLFANFECQKKSGVFYPIPQYPIYPATAENLNLQKIEYFLDEVNNWNLDIKYLNELFNECENYCIPKALVVINPGNPTGQVLSKQNIKDIIIFAHEKQLFILVDEVYQDNVYVDGIEFHSFKKVLFEMGPPYTELQIASFMSCSKGYMSECGVRGGYVEVLNLTPDMKFKLTCILCTNLCPNILGQTAIYCVTNPLKIGEPSYELFMKEKMDVLNELKLKAKIVTDGFNSLERFTCNEVQGAMFAFPQIHLPPKAIEAAKRCGQSPDEFYAFKLLEKTGICVTPGIAFGQKEGTYHFRSTILPSTEKLKMMFELFQVFNNDFFLEYK